MSSFEKPLVSIITPSWNSAAFIEQTILSVINQTYNNIEYIVIDGGSSDNTLEIINKYSDSIAYLVSEPDNGMYHAINKGISLANGQIVAYLNSDDLYYPNSLSKVVKIFNDNPSADLVYGNLDFIDAAGNKLFTQIYPSFNWSRFVSANFAMIGQPSAFWRKGLIEEIGLFDETMKMASDFDFFIRAGKDAKLLHVQEILAAFRIHLNSLTGSQRKLGDEEVCRIHEKYIERPVRFHDFAASSIYSIYFKMINWRAVLTKLVIILTRKSNE
jgi:glycosyltransferase involved in cell wall biosynthesis